MTKEQLEGYVSTKEEIAELKVLLENTKDECTDNDVIMDYRSGYPVPQSVVGSSTTVKRRSEKNRLKNWKKNVHRLRNLWNLSRTALSEEFFGSIIWKERRRNRLQMKYTYTEAEFPKKSLII